MKPKFLFISLALTALLFLPACTTLQFSNAVRGQGERQSHEFAVGNYSRIRVEGHIDIDYFAESSGKVELLIQPNLLPFIEITVVEDELVVKSTREFTMNSNNPPVLRVWTASLSSVNIAGVSAFTAHDTIEAVSFDVSISGAASLIADLNVDEMALSISGAASAELSGRADAININLSGAGEVKGLELMTKEASIGLAGVGAVRISCSEKLSISAGGMGTVEYRGTPAISSNAGGMVSISKVD